MLATAATGPPEAFTAEASAVARPASVVPPLSGRPPRIAGEQATTSDWLVTPSDAVAATQLFAPAAAAAPAKRRSRSSAVIVVCSCIAIIVSGGVYWLAGSKSDNRDAEPPRAVMAVAQPVEPIAGAPVVEAVPVAPEIAPAAPVASADSKEVLPSPVPEPGYAPEPRGAAQPVGIPNAAPGPAAAAPQDAPVATASPEEVEALTARGDQLLATGDIAAARLFFERAAEQGSVSAATGIGKTFDPLFLEQMHVLGIRGDAAIAAQWYRKAVAAGDHQGQNRLDRLLARFPG